MRLEAESNCTSPAKPDFVASTQISTSSLAVKSPKAEELGLELGIGLEVGIVLEGVEPEAHPARATAPSASAAPRTKRSKRGDGMLRK
ncbi:hypothetical protein CQ040_19890 [Microbacterium sp. MYb54]|nr:hypothetical protein CQ031_18710 [Microbacterium sp. MYb40]PRB14562.1 hypothetical protein CQ040_19890 [Microbacterium sp. MYb54]PRB66710.1 hypothetical protein CQ027_19015 [Microbacterium sp. MYb32]